MFKSIFIFRTLTPIPHSVSPGDEIIINPGKKNMFRHLERPGLSHNHGGRPPLHGGRPPLHGGRPPLHGGRPPLHGSGPSDTGHVQRPGASDTSPGLGNKFFKN